MNKFLVAVWSNETMNVDIQRTYWVEAESKEEIEQMTEEEFNDAIYDYDDTLDEQVLEAEMNSLYLDSIDILLDDSDNVLPSDHKPDLEDIDPNSGRDDK